MRTIKIDDAAVGQVGVLVRGVGPLPRRGEVTSWSLEADPRTNMGWEPKELGWLGETDNWDREAFGRYRVVAIRPDGRADLQRTTDDINI